MNLRASATRESSATRRATRTVVLVMVTTAALGLALAPSIVRGDTSPGNDPNPVVPVVFAPAIAPLSKAPLPAYLPSWLPSAMPAQAHALTSIKVTKDSSVPSGQVATYETDLSISPSVGCTACNVLSIKGSTKGFAHTSQTKRVWIIPGIPAYFTPAPDGPWMSFRIDVTYYAVRCMLPNPSGQGLHPCSIAQYLYIVDSLVWVN